MQVYWKLKVNGVSVVSKKSDDLVFREITPKIFDLFRRNAGDVTKIII